jgi:hypothetical protein
MADLFKEIVPSILQTKVNYLRDDVDLKEYSPFMVNRALSYHMDCVLYANEMNKHHSIDKDMQYQYLLNTIRPMKRKFQPWQKSEKEKDIDCVKTYFSYSNQKAKDALRVLSKEQISQIKELVDIGGTQKNTK